MGFWVLDTAAWYSPEKLPWLSAADTCILEPSSFSHQPVTSYCGGEKQMCPWGCLHTDPTPAPQAEPPTRTPQCPWGAHSSLPGELRDPRTHLPVPVGTCAASAPVHGTSGEPTGMGRALRFMVGSCTAKEVAQPEPCSSPPARLQLQLQALLVLSHTAPPRAGTSHCPGAGSPGYPCPNSPACPWELGSPHACPLHQGRHAHAHPSRQHGQPQSIPPPSEQPAWQELPSASPLELGVLLLLRIPSTDGSSMSVPPQTLGPPWMLPCSLPQG